CASQSKTGKRFRMRSSSAMTRATLLCVARDGQGRLTRGDLVCYGRVDDVPSRTGAGGRRTSHPHRRRAALRPRVRHVGARRVSRDGRDRRRGARRDRRRRQRADRALSTQPARAGCEAHAARSERRATPQQSPGPNESFDQSLGLRIGDLTPGRWPFQLRVDYTDANQYPFQALQVNADLVGQPPPAKMTVPLVKPDPLATTSPLHVRLKNLTGTARTVAVSVLVPEGLDVAEPIQPVALAGWEDKPVTAQLVNRSALPGSKY